MWLSGKVLKCLPSVLECPQHCKKKKKRTQQNMRSLISYPTLITTFSSDKNKCCFFGTSTFKKQNGVLEAVDKWWAFCQNKQTKSSQIFVWSELLYLQLFNSLLPKHSENYSFLYESPSTPSWVVEAFLWYRHIHTWGWD